MNNFTLGEAMKLAYEANEKIEELKKYIDEKFENLEKIEDLNEEEF